MAAATTEAIHIIHCFVLPYQDARAAIQQETLVHAVPSWPCDDPDDEVLRKPPSKGTPIKAAIGVAYPQMLPFRRATRMAQVTTWLCLIGGPANPARMNAARPVLGTSFTTALLTGGTCGANNSSEDQYGSHKTDVTQSQFHIKLSHGLGLVGLSAFDRSVSRSLLLSRTNLQPAACSVGICKNSSPRLEITRMPRADGKPQPPATRACLLLDT
ncbi:hypothetical protein V8E51_014939 [Hyaloscypha variabilis]